MKMICEVPCRSIFWYMLYLYVPFIYIYFLFYFFEKNVFGILLNATTSFWFCIV